MAQPANQIQQQSDAQSGRNPANNSSQLIAGDEISMNRIVDFLRDQ